jgi:predicted ATPase/class 3 adenylate cyclase/tetratricopeptide (TPR) repeat protein
MSEQRALLLTDVVDSTELARRLGDAAMSALWTAHDRAARDLLRQWRGREIDKSDGFLLMFLSAADAVGYALAYHRALAGLSVPLKARAGLHVGPVTLRENHLEDVAQGAKPIELEGVAKPITARVMSLAQGGQTLLTADARTALGATALRVQGHGHWRIKGLEEPFDLFEVGEEGAPFTPPPDSAKVYRVVRRNELWVPMREIRHSLPAERDAFIGREVPLQELARRFDAGARLVSVLGIGGTGKTRLAQRFGWTWLGDYPGGVWFCDLSQARTLDGIVHAVAQGLDVPLGSAEPIAQLGSALAGHGPCLVILDMFEQVARHAEETIGQWLNRAPEACFIVTTREVLSVAGEQALAVAPLEPDEGTRLFLRRAQAARRDFAPTLEDHTAIGPLVKLLDGLPLAIELAAARVRVMPPRMLLQRMSERFKLLASIGGRRDRQATLRSTFDWSWELLPAPERAALAQLSVFEAGFTLEATEAVLDLSTCDQKPWVPDVIQSLVEKSLLRQVSDHRMDMLGTVKEYALEHLRTEGRYNGSGPDAMSSAWARHWRYFAGLGESNAVVDRCIEIDNLVVACRRAKEANDTPCAVGALVNSWAALKLCGPFRVAVDLAAAVSEATDLPSQERSVVEWVAGSARHMLGHTDEAHSLFCNGLAHAREGNSSYWESQILTSRGDQLASAGLNEAALNDLTQALSIARRLGDAALQCKALNSLGALSNELANFEHARECYESALQLSRKLQDLRWEGGLLGNLGVLHYGQGHLELAREQFEAALRLAIQVGDRRWEGNARCNLALLQHDMSKPTEAAVQFEAALAMAREMGHRRLECTVLCNLGMVVESQGKLTEARVLYERASEIARELGDKRSEGQFRSYLGRVYARLGSIESARECLHIGESLLAEVSDRVSMALLECSRAEVESLAGNLGAAENALRRAERQVAALCVGPESELGRRLAQVRPLIVPS